MKKIKYFIEAIIIYFFFFLILVLGITLSRHFFSKIFIILGPLFRSKEIIKKNLNKINPNLEAREIDNLMNKMWSNYGKVFIEYIFLKKFKKDKNHIKIINEKILDEISNSKRPVIFVSGHFANFELMSMELTKKNIKLATIYRPLNNFFLNPFMEFLRKKYICQNQIKKGKEGLKSLIKFVEEKHSVALMIDQRLGEGEKLDFFGSPALTTTLPAQIALKFNYEIVPIYISRKEDNKFQIEVYKPLSIKSYKKNEESKIVITKKLNEIIESMIKKDPSQWILSHNRWK
tara:strand:+ start:4859 stop:5725 length:867 start_codon:yes stop_codon:yes gene_type:complete